MKIISKYTCCLSKSKVTTFEFDASSRHGDYNYNRCQSCDLIQVQPRPSIKQLQQFYSIDNTYSVNIPNDRCVANYRIEALKEYKLIDKPHNLNILDVGCNNGVWLKNL